MPKDLFDHLPRCRKDTPAGTLARSRISKLRPTQNAVGRDEVAAKVTAFEARDDKAQQAYLLTRPVPVIIGDGGHAHLVDHHHLAAAALEALGDVDLPVTVVKNWEPLEGKYFWKEMLVNHWMYNFDADGGGPIAYQQMSRRIDDLGNDIFRSVAWVARLAHAYEKSADNAIFAEFRWANFFRTHLLLPQLLDHKDDLASLTLADIAADHAGFMDELRSEVIALARSPLAAGLPGWSR